MYIFIVNPTAGNGKAKRIFKQIVDSALYKTIDSKFYVTKYPGHAEEITTMLLVNDFIKLRSLIVIGGDGTLHEVVNGLKNSRIPLSFIPGGSGNDFARGCVIKDSPIELLKQTIEGRNSISYWLGKYHVNHGVARSFVNSVGFGFDAEIAKKANDSRYKPLLNTLRLGTISYLIALIQVLFTFKPMDIELELNGNKRLIKKCWMITISNHPYYGGGMKIIPQTKIQPNTFPVLIIRSISKWKILALFMTVFSGKHLLFKEVELLYTTKVKIYSHKNICFHADGETSTCHSCIITKQSQPLVVSGTNYKTEKHVS